MESFLDGNATSTIPHKYSSRQRDAFECGCANGAGPTTLRGSHVYEINTWLCNLDGPSLAWAASQWPRLRRSEGSPGPMLPNELSTHQQHQPQPATQCVLPTGVSRTWVSSWGVNGELQNIQAILPTVPSSKFKFRDFIREIKQRADLA